MTSYCLPCWVEGEEAARYFSRPRLGNLYGLLTRPVQVAVTGSQESRKPPFVERIWIPLYAVNVRTITKQGERLVWTSVEAISGEFAMLEGIDEAVARDLDEEWLDPAILETDAAVIARKGLLRYIMAQRGQINKPRIESVDEIRLCYMPVWVLYYRRRRKLIDIKVLDGISGKPAGAKMRISVINAFVAKKKRTQGCRDHHKPSASENQ